MDIASGMDSFITGTQDPALIAATQTLEALWGEPQETYLWQFATDGGNFSKPGVTCIGFAPGDETLPYS